MFRRSPGLAITLTLVSLIVGIGFDNAVAAPPTQDIPAAVIENDEGGPVVIVGKADYTDFSIPIVAQEPVPALLDMSAAVGRDNRAFASVESQALGFLTTPLSPPPAEYMISLPAVPVGQSVDVDNDGEEDTGVQIFRLVLAANISGGSDLVQLDQQADLNSYLTDPLSGEITEGALLLYAEDDQQGFPQHGGDDGLFFTADDEIVRLPQGYTVAALGSDGGVTFDRSREGRIDVLEKPSSASPDFSDQGILESYNSLLDLLSSQYAYTELRQLDWDEIRERYLSDVQEADAAQSTPAYYAILHEMAQSIRDAHVETAPPNTPGGSALILAPVAANLGVNTVELSDGRIIVSEVIEGSPGDLAGLVFGAEIVTVNGQDVAERLPEVLYTDSVGTEEGQHLRQVRDLLKFPAESDVTLAYRLPETSEMMTISLTADAFALSDPLRFERGLMPLQYDALPGGYGYVSWNEFVDPIPTIEMFKDFLRTAQSHRWPGVVLDLRSNSGGWDNLYFTMGSYFFDADDPVPHGWNEESYYDETEDAFVPAPVSGYSLSAPDPSLAYGGDVVILVDASCASSCEFFTQFLQSSGRVTVVGQYGTKGAGGSVNRAAMPDGIIFQFTKGQSRFAGTDTFNIEAKGVDLDVRVPVTLESEQAKLDGGDPVLEAGLSALAASSAAQLRETLIPVTSPDGVVASLAPPDWPLNETAGAYLSPDGAQLILFGAIEPPIDSVEELLAARGLPDAASALDDTRTANGREWSIYAAADGAIVRQFAVADTDAATYLIEVISSSGDPAVLRSGLLEPAIDAFKPVK